MMEKILNKYPKFDGIWHFTDCSNIDLIIEQQGLLSLAELERRKIAIPMPGGNNWSHDADRMKGLDEYVHLAFVDDHPMLFLAKKDGRIENPIWLKIDVSIILAPNVKFCSDVSNKSGAQIFESAQAASEIDFDVLFTYMDWKNPEIQQRRKEAIKSEILVPNIVPIEKILGYKNG